MTSDNNSAFPERHCDQLGKLFNLILHFGLQALLQQQELLLPSCWLCVFFLYLILPQTPTVRFCNDRDIFSVIYYSCTVFSERCVWVRVNGNFKGVWGWGSVFFLPCQHISHVEEQTNKQQKRSRLDGTGTIQLTPLGIQRKCMTTLVTWAPVLEKKKGV